MSEKSAGKTRFMLTTRRIEALADGIFAIAMTLLILSLTLPDMLETQLDLSQLLAAQGPNSLTMHSALCCWQSSG